jgi:hypothetical protein
MEEEGMRLPGTRYQEPGWEEVRKLLGQCSLAALHACGPARPDGLGLYVDLVAADLARLRETPRARAAGNAYGETVFELALTLVYELQARPADWDALCAALDGAEGTPDALVRKKVNDMYAVLRDKVDADNYQAACGRPCSPNRMYAYRMLDTTCGEITRLFADWHGHRAQVGAILGRPLDGAAAPIEVRQLRGPADCRPEWVLRWSATLAQFGAGPGPLHTRSKRFDALKDNPGKIGTMLQEIGEYAALSANGAHAEGDWVRDLDDASVWVEDYWRVLQESEAAGVPGPDQILEAAHDPLDVDDGPSTDDADPAPPDPRWEAAALAVSLPPGYLHAVAAMPDAGGLLAGDDPAVRLAVFARLLGPDDDSYPDDWRDPATGALPTMQQLAVLGGVSLPTLRKRRDAAIARLASRYGPPVADDAPLQGK